MNLYEELYKVKEAQVDALQNRVMDVEQQVYDLEKLLEGVARWIDSIHGNETSNKIIQQLKKCQKVSLANKRKIQYRCS